MPKLKQPTSLEKRAFNVLLESVVRCCDELSTACEDSSDKLRQGISVIKENVCKHIPSPLLADFCRMFLDQFFSDSRSACHKKAAVEIVMDIDIVGFRYKAPILAFIDLEDRHRIRRLMKLDLYRFWNDVHIGLDNFNLNDLTTLIFPVHCTDSDLVIIGQNCPKLKLISVRSSRNVTDNGLGALSPCAELCAIDIVACPAVSHFGINDLLSMHKKLEDFACGDNRLGRSFAVSHLDLSARYPSMNRFFIRSGVFSDTDLRFIVEKFPNLTYLGIDGFHMDSLALLKSMNKLEQLEFHGPSIATSLYNPDNFQRMWMCLMEILPCIGMNITSLSFSFAPNFFLQEKCLKFLYKSCPNIAQLRFNFKDDFLVIPPFKKLTELAVCCPVDLSDWSDDPPEPVFRFVKMLRLETLMFVGRELRARAIESIIFDDIRFPKLSLIYTSSLERDELLELEQKVKIRNLNLQIKNNPRPSRRAR